MIWSAWTKEKARGQAGTNPADAAVAPELITKDQLVDKS